MKLVYYFDNVRCVELADNQYGAVSPRYTERYRDIEYEYNHDISVDDVNEYFNIDGKDIFEFINIEWLEEDAGFIDYMTDKYQDKAYQECVERYGSE